jgi:hypothetical protein
MGPKSGQNLKDDLDVELGVGKVVQQYGMLEQRTRLHFCRQWQTDARIVVPSRNLSA